MVAAEDELDAVNLMAKVKQVLNEYNNSNGKRSELEGKLDTSQMEKVPDELGYLMFPELFQGRKPTIGEFTPADTAKLLQRDNLEHRTDVIMKLIRYSCGGATGVSKQMDTRCAEKNREFVRKCVESNQGGDEAQPAPRAVRWGEGKADAECVTLTPLEILQNVPQMPPSTGRECDAIPLTVSRLQSDVLAAIQCTNIGKLELDEGQRGEFFPYLDILYRLKEDRMQRTNGQITPPYYEDILNEMKRPNIDLRNWNLSDSGVIAVCRGGMLNHALTINLGGINISADGGKAVAKCISTSKLMRSINLTYNNLDGEQARQTPAPRTRVPRGRY